MTNRQKKNRTYYILKIIYADWKNVQIKEILKIDAKSSFKSRYVTSLMEDSTSFFKISNFHFKQSLKCDKLMPQSNSPIVIRWESKNV